MIRNIQCSLKLLIYRVSVLQQRRVDVIQQNSVVTTERVLMISCCVTSMSTALTAQMNKNVLPVSDGFTLAF